MSSRREDIGSSDICRLLKRGSQCIKMTISPSETMFSKLSERITVEKTISMVGC